MDKEQVFYTDYPFVELGDEPYKKAPIRQINSIDLYDGDKYCYITINGIKLSVKRGYIYLSYGRLGDEIESLSHEDALNFFDQELLNLVLGVL